MADYSIGKLQLVFSTLNRTKQGFKNVTNELNSLKAVIGELGGINLNPFINNINKVTAALKPYMTKTASAGVAALAEITKKMSAAKIDNITQQVQAVALATREAREETEEFANAIAEGVADSVEKTKQEVKGYNKEQASMIIAQYRAEQAAKAQEQEFYRIMLATGQAGENTYEYIKAIKAYEKEQEKSNKKTKKSRGVFAKLWLSIKRIAVYRLIRTGLRQVVSSVSNAASAFSVFDDNINNTMTSLTSSLSVLKLSLGTLVLPLLEAVEPILKEISVAAAEMANTISQAMSTTGKYTKINTEYLKDYRSQVQQAGGTLAFDKFQALSGSGGLSDFLIPDQEVEENNEKVSGLVETISRLKNIIAQVWNIIKQGWVIVQPYISTFLDIVENSILPAINGVVTGIGWVLTKINELGLAEPILNAILTLITLLGAKKLIDGIKNLALSFNGLSAAILAVSIASALIANWDNLSDSAKKLVGVLSLVVGVLTSVAIAAMVAKGVFEGVAAIGALTVAAAAGAVFIRSLINTDSAKKMASGGAVTKGTYFLAGEAGTEVVSHDASGKTEVTNVTQMETAFYNALVRYGTRGASGSGGAVNVYIDGRQVFNSVRSVARSQGLDFAKKQTL